MELPVSVIIPTHNRAFLLENAVQSVLKQTFQALEIIIVDDASNDETKQVLEKLSFLDKRIHVITNSKPMGGARSRNLGIAASQGKWIAFLDDDDSWLPEKLEWQIKALSDASNAVASSCAYVAHYPFSIKKTVHTPSHLALDQLLQGNVLGGASVCVCNAAVLKKIGGFDDKLRSAQDWDLWVRLRMQGDIISVNKPLVQYQVHFNYRISNDMNAKYRGSRLFYFKHKASMNEQARVRNLGFICYIQSRQAHRRLRSRFKQLSLSVANSPLRVGVAYVVSSFPRMAVESLSKLVRLRS